MPRGARKQSGVGIYHVMLRGTDKRAIFLDDEDCRSFLEFLTTVREISAFRLYAWCLMGNHVHLLLQEGGEPLAQIFRRLATRYAYYFNQKYDLCGHLFQDRFRSEPIEDDAYFLDVLRYICKNPVKAGLSETPFDYRWLGCSGIRSECPVDSLGKLTDLTGEALLDFVSQPTDSEHLDYERTKRLSDRDASKVIISLCGCRSPAELSGDSREQQADAVRKAAKAGISIRQLSRLTGISKAVIERILKQEQ